MELHVAITAELHSCVVAPDMHQLQNSQIGTSAYSGKASEGD